MKRVLWEAMKKVLRSSEREEKKIKREKKTIGQVAESKLEEARFREEI